jgi:uncharacterized protein
MKYLLLVVMVVVVVWAIKRGQQAGKPDQSARSQPPEKPSEMVACAHCGVHLPHPEAVTGRHGVYCSTEHRSTAQDRNPG